MSAIASRIASPLSLARALSAVADWQYRQRVTEVAGTGKECDNATGEALFRDTKREDIAEAAPRCHDHEEVSTFAGGDSNEEE